MTILQALSAQKSLLGRLKDVDSFAVARAMAVQQNGLAVLPKTMALHDLQSGRLCEFREFELSNWERLPIGLCLLGSPIHNRALVRFVSDIRALHHGKPIGKTTEKPRGKTGVKTDLRLSLLAHSPNSG